MCTAKQIDYLFSNWSVSNGIAIRSYKGIKAQRICLYVKLNHAFLFNHLLSTAFIHLRGRLVPKQKIFGCHVNGLTRYRESFSDTN